MKKLFIRHILAVLLPLSFFTEHVNGQDFLVTTQGDTLKGELKPYTIGPSKKVVVVSSNKNKTTHPILKVRLYTLDGVAYHPVRSERGYEFMKVIKPGYLTLYGYQLENQSRFDGLFLAKKDGQYLEVPNLSFKKLMTRFLDDCPEVAEKIDNGTLEKRDLHQIIDQYNECIDNRTVDNDKALALQKKTKSATMSWDALEGRIQNHPEFARKADALEMVSDIKGRISRSEKIPNFVIQGLKDALAGTELTSDVENLLTETQD